MPIIRQGSPMSGMPPAVRARVARMLSMPRYMRTHGTGDYFGLNTPMSLTSPLYHSAASMGLTSNQAGMGCAGCGGNCKSCGGLGATATDWMPDSSAGIATQFGISPFATSYPIIGNTIPNWAFWAVGALVAMSMFGKR